MTLTEQVPSVMEIVGASLALALMIGGWVGLRVWLKERYPRRRKN